MEWNRIFGLLFSGFMMKLYAAAMGVWMAYEVGNFLFATMAPIVTALK